MKGARLIWGIGAILAVCGAAMGQSGAANQQPPLKGPEVPGSADSKGKSSFGDKSSQGKKKSVTAPLTMEGVVRAVESLRGDVSLTSEQGAAVKKAAADFAAKTKDYFAAHKDETTRLKGNLRPEDAAAYDAAVQSGGPLKVTKYGFAGRGGGHGKKGIGRDAEMTDPNAPKVDMKTAQESRERLAQIFNERPKVEPARDQVWGLLTPAQQAAADEALAKQSEERTGKRGGGAGGEGGRGAGMAAALAEDKTVEDVLNDERIPAKLRDRIRELPPEKQAAAVQRLRERARKEGGGEES